MATLNDQPVRELLEQPNFAVVSTLNADGSVLSTVAWIGVDHGEVAVNSALGRKWPANLERDPRITAVVAEAGNPYHFVEIRGTVTADRETADEHVNRLAKKYLGQDEYPFRAPGEQRIKFVIAPDHVRHVQQ
jgi:PPOX class probable F420-dependent enzyme